MENVRDGIYPDLTINYGLLEGQLVAFPLPVLPSTGKASSAFRCLTCVDHPLMEEQHSILIFPKGLTTRSPLWSPIQRLIRITGPNSMSMVISLGNTVSGCWPKYQPIFMIIYSKSYWASNIFPRS